MSDVIYRGKVRDIYSVNETQLKLTASDRVSAFDRNLGIIPYKGAVLTQLSAWWFAQTQHIIPNHFIRLIGSNSMLVRKCKVLPIEVVVRGYLTGSTKTAIWSLYQQGQRKFFDLELPDNLTKDSKLRQPIVTPTTKSETSDQPLCQESIYQHIDFHLWHRIRNIALKLFHYGQDVAEANNLILVDTKYEFGLDNLGQLCLIDELHTPDSSRYWSNTISTADSSKIIYDKELLRQWYVNNSDPYNDETLPSPPVELINLLSDRYRELFEKLTKQKVKLNAN